MNQRTPEQAPAGPEAKELQAGVQEVVEAKKEEREATEDVKSKGKAAEMIRKIKESSFGKQAEELLEKVGMSLEDGLRQLFLFASSMPLFGGMAKEMLTTMELDSAPETIKDVFGEKNTGNLLEKKNQKILIGVWKKAIKDSSDPMSFKAFLEEKLADNPTKKTPWNIDDFAQTQAEKETALAALNAEKEERKKDEKKLKNMPRKELLIGASTGKLKEYNDNSKYETKKKALEEKGVKKKEVNMAIEYLSNAFVQEKCKETLRSTFQYKKGDEEYSENTISKIEVGILKGVQIEFKEDERWEVEYKKSSAIMSEDQVSELFEAIEARNNKKIEDILEKEEHPNLKEDILMEVNPEQKDKVEEENTAEKLEQKAKKQSRHARRAARRKKE